MSQPVPVTIVGGFLGSGKTTLLNRALAGDHGRKIAVIVNELGEIGLDAELLEGGEGFVEMDNGCLCCALKEDLVATLGEIGERSDLDQVFIETTGIADPLPVGHSILRPELRGRFELDAVVITADAQNLEAALESGPEAGVQLRCADFIVTTKLDQVDEARTAEVDDALAKMNPSARRLDGRDSGLFELLLGGLTAASDDAEPRESGLFSGPQFRPLRPEGHGFESLALDLGGKSTIRLCFEEFLDDLPPGVFRAKGIVKLDGEYGRLVFHRVAGRCEVTQEPERDGDTRLVFIGKDFDREALRGEVESLFEAV